MSAPVSKDRDRQGPRRGSRPRADDPRVVRSRAAAVDAARTLFLRQGYAATTMAEIAHLAGLTKRTLYNNYGDKEALFTGIIGDVIGYAEKFTRGLEEQFTVEIAAEDICDTLEDLGRRLALSIVRPEVVALRRLLVGEARAFPDLAREYYDRAPGRVIETLAAGFERLAKRGVLRVSDSRCAAAQFAYLVAGESLDRAMLVGTIPAQDHVIAAARTGVETFLARYGRECRQASPKR